MLPFLNLSWAQLLLTVIGLLILRECWKYLRLWLYLQGLKKKGAEIYFKPPIGMAMKYANDAKRGDAFAWFKESIQKNPKLRFLASHYLDKPLIYLADPTLIKAFLADPSKTAKAFIFGPLLPLLENGLVFSNGNQWKKHRKTLSTIFEYGFIMSQIPTIVNTARHIFSKEIEAKKGKHIDILDLYQMITGELVFRIFFGEELEGATIDEEPLTSYLASLLELGFYNARAPENILFGVRGIKLGLFKRNRDYMHKSQKFLSFCKELIQLKKKKLEENPGNQKPGTKSDLLTLLLQGQKQSKGTADEFSDEEILHDFITFFFAGMDTTGHMLTMATYYFAKQSEEVQNAVLKEANEFSQAGVNITGDLINKYETIHAFFKETLRLGTPATVLILRDVVATQQVEDITLRKGSMVNAAFVANNHNPEIYREPYRFNMYRWIPESPDFEEEVRKHPFNFIPFSAGPRNCIGQHLAILEGKIIWSIFLSTYKYTVPSDYEIHFKFGSMNGPREVLYLDIEKK